MPSKKELQTILKEKYGINKNISQSLATADCEQLLAALQREPSTVKLVESFAEKNTDLGQRNQYFGRLRNNAEKKFEKLQSEYQQFERVPQHLRTPLTRPKRLSRIANMPCSNQWAT